MCRKYGYKEDKPEYAGKRIAQVFFYGKKKYLTIIVSLNGIFIFAIIVNQVEILNTTIFMVMAITKQFQFHLIL